MEILKYKVGDKVRIKSKEWYDANKNGYGCVVIHDDMMTFTNIHASFCGREAVITVACNIGYEIDIDDKRFVWQDYMFDEDYVAQDTKSKISEEVSKVRRRFVHGSSVKFCNGVFYENEILVAVDKIVCVFYRQGEDRCKVKVEGLEDVVGINCSYKKLVEVIDIDINLTNESV